MDKAHRLSAAIEATGAVKAQLARAAGFTPSDLQRLLNGEVKRSKYWAPLADVLGVPRAWLLTGSGPAPDWAATTTEDQGSQHPSTIRSTEEALIAEIRSMKEMIKECINVLEWVLLGMARRPKTPQHERFDRACEHAGVAYKKEVAREIGIKNQFLNSMLAGDRPGNEHWPKIAKFLGVPLPWLRHGYPPSPPWDETAPPPPTEDTAVIAEIRSMKEMMQQCINTLQAENDELRGRITRLEAQGPNTGRDETEQRTA